MKKNKFLYDIRFCENRYIYLNQKNCIEAVDISYNNYIVIGTDGKQTSQSVASFLNKIGGIVHNNSWPKNGAYKKYCKYI